jgi:NADPH-dependent glutamate synthase beta subunit-like oxidoreductase/ferredoxin
MLLKGTAGGKPPLFLPCSTTSTAANKTGAWRFFHPVYLEKTAPCAAACPSGEDIARVEMLAASGAYQDAWQTLMAENPFPAVCGRVCFHPCERACNRGRMDEPVAIRQLERSLGDRANDEGWLPTVRRPQPKNKTAAVIGAGPAGLSAAYFLARLGYSCEVFEARPEPGGLLRWGIPAYRLPVDILAAEIDRIRELGVRIQCSAAMGAARLHELQGRFDALIVTCGYDRPIGLKISGAEYTIDGLAMLSHLRSRVPTPQTGTVAVIGGGNTAIDAARSLIRLGAAPIIVYRRRREDMPAFEPEIDRALEEGIQLKELAAPISVEPDLTAEPPAYKLTLQKMTPSPGKAARRMRVRPLEGQTETLRVNQIVTAIGAELADDCPAHAGGAHSRLQMSHCHLINADRPIILGGDITTPAKSVADAIGSGKQAAIALDIYFEQGIETIAAQMAACQVGPGPAVSMAAYGETAIDPETKKSSEAWAKTPALVGFDQINLDYFEPARRVTAPYLERGKRISSFSECEGSLPPAAARSEAQRCFNCGICSACDNCRLFCPESAVHVNKAIRSIDLDYCKGCGVCVAECPRNAMAMEE